MCYQHAFPYACTQCTVLALLVDFGYSTAPNISPHSFQGMLALGWHPGYCSLLPSRLHCVPFFSSVRCCPQPCLGAMQLAFQAYHPLSGVHFWQSGFRGCVGKVAATTWCFQGTRCCGQLCPWRTHSMLAGSIFRWRCGQRLLMHVPRCGRVVPSQEKHVSLLHNYLAGRDDAPALQCGHAGGGGGELGLLDMGWACGVCTGCSAEGWECLEAAATFGGGAACCSGAVCCRVRRCEEWRLMSGPHPLLLQAWSERANCCRLQRELYST